MTRFHYENTTLRYFYVGYARESNKIYNWLPVWLTIIFNSFCISFPIIHGDVFIHSQINTIRNKLLYPYAGVLAEGSPIFLINLHASLLCITYYLYLHGDLSQNAEINFKPPRLSATWMWLSFFACSVWHEHIFNNQWSWNQICIAFIIIVQSTLNFVPTFVNLFVAEKKITTLSKNIFPELMVEQIITTLASRHCAWLEWVKISI